MRSIVEAARTHNIHTSDGGNATTAERRCFRSAASLFVDNDDDDDVGFVARIVVSV